MARETDVVAEFKDDVAGVDTISTLTFKEKGVGRMGEGLNIETCA